MALLLAVRLARFVLRFFSDSSDGIATDAERTSDASLGYPFSHGIDYRLLFFGRHTAVDGVWRPDFLTGATTKPVRSAGVLSITTNLIALAEGASHDDHMPIIPTKLSLL